jgi:hypothetical protein
VKRRRPPSAPGWREFVLVFLILIFPFVAVVTWMSANPVFVLVGAGVAAIAYMAYRRWTD